MEEDRESRENEKESKQEVGLGVIGGEGSDVTEGLMRAGAVSGCPVAFPVTSRAHYEEIKR